MESGGHYEYISGFIILRRIMEEYYVRLQYEKGDDEFAIGFFATEPQITHLIDIAKRNQLFMVVEQEYDFTGEK